MIIFANNAVSQLAAPLLSSQTTLTVTAMTGELFPVPGVGEYFKLTLEDRRNRTIEICHCTGRAGDVLTILRAQEDTTALNFAIGTTVANRFTRDSADAIIAQVTPANPWYLGPFATAPVLDNEGNPLVAGQQYWDTTLQVFFIYTGASWVNQQDGTNAISTASGTFIVQDPSAGFDGVEDDFDLRYIDYSAAVQIPDVTVAEQFFIFLDGVMLKAGTDYTIPVLGTIHFTTPPAADVSFLGRWVALTTIAVGGSGLSQEQVDDRVAALLVEGANITLTYNDPAGTITIASAGGGGGGASVTVSDTAPGSPSAGDLWWNSDDGTLYVYYFDGSSSQWVVVVPMPNGSSIAALDFKFDGGGSPVAAGSKVWLEVPFDCVIVQATSTSDQSCSAVFDVWKDAYANFPPTAADTITGGAKPTIVTALKAQDQALSGWTVNVSDGDLLLANVDSNDNANLLNLSLKVVKV